jgi:lysophospholipase L1-like esterase
MSTDAYVKEAAARFPGPWGWMTMSRVGGRAGDVSRALLYFDVSKIPKGASIKEAKLHLTLTPYTNARAEAYRYGAYLLRLPDAPGWTDTQVTSRERRAGVRWPGAGLAAASNGKPISIGKVTARPDRNRLTPGAMEFDLTGALRAWIQGKTLNCGIVIDNRIEGGAFDFYSCRSFKPELRPYLEIALSPAIETTPEPVDARPALPPGDYWVEPMREVRKKQKGKSGTLAQYGDSITVTMAFLAGFSYGKEIAPKNCPPHIKREMDVVAAYSDRNLWREWKGGGWGNTGMMMSDWLLANIDEWQKKMNPEVAVILFGTNDLGRIMPPEYTENMAASLRRMMADGTVPILTTVPPKSGRDEMVRDYWLAGVSIAHGLKVPVIDYYSEIMRRRPDDWNGRLERFNEYKGYDVPTLISRDGTHPSNPARYVNDFSEEALNSSGYGLRNYMTLRQYHAVIVNALRSE